MRILEMQATFGKLEGAKLSLKPGLSVIEAPNEWGKSTWCAFAAAMLYGVDTRERSGRGSLAVKEKYAPWSGKPMEGRMILEQGGRRITLERFPQGRTPMGGFRAYETDTGLEIPGLTGENCGEQLLGVERSVFCRSAFVRFADLPMEPDDSLRQRLEALVSTGDESGSGRKLGEQLGALKRSIRYHGRGLLPQVQEELDELERQLAQAQAMARREEELLGRLRMDTQRQEDLRLHREMTAYERSMEARRLLEARADSAKELRERLERQEQTVAALPSREELAAQLEQGEALAQRLAQAEPVSTGSAMGLWILWGLTALAALSAVGLRISGRPLWAVALQAALGLGISGLFLTVRRKKAEKNRREQDARRLEKMEELEGSMERWRQGLEDWEALTELRQRYGQEKQSLQDLMQVVQVSEKPEGEDYLTLSAGETELELAQLERQVQEQTIQLAQLRGQMEQLPDLEALQRRIQAAQARKGELERYERALTYSQAALETAAQELQRRFAPRLSALAGEAFSRLTGGRYQQISIGSDWTVQTASREETVLRTPLWRSEGTADQMYLALRLAVWQVLCPEAPLILDDVFVRWDEERLGYGLALLEELGKTHQILLFTCRFGESRPGKAMSL